MRGIRVHVQKQSCEIELDADVLRRAKLMTRDLNGTIETLLASYVEAEEAKRASERALVEQWITNSNAFIEQHGSPGDEFDIV